MSDETFIRSPLDKLYRVRYNWGEVRNVDEKYEALRLKNQLCFPIYAASNLITRKYKPYLDALDLTYTQYIVMMVLWEQGRTNEKLLCRTLRLKSNTLAPLLKKLGEKGYIEKAKDRDDERNLVITPTAVGQALRDRALSVPGCIAKEIDLTPEEAALLYRTLYKILDHEKENAL